MLLVTVVIHDIELEQLDVKTMFLQEDLEEKIYMQQLEGFKEAYKDNLVCSSKNSLYRLKQSHRQWYKCFVSYMIMVGYI